MKSIGDRGDLEIDWGRLKTRLDKARIKCDHLKWILDAMGIGSDDGARTVTWQVPVVWKTGDTGSDLFVAIWPDKTNKTIRVKMNIGSLSSPISETDGVEFGFGGVS